MWQRTTSTAFVGALPLRVPAAARSPLLPAPLAPKRRRHARRATCLIEPLNTLDITANLRTPIATGSFGEVFFGHLSSGEPVVLKRANSAPLAQTLFRVERRINRKLARGGASAAAPLYWPRFLGEHVRHSQTFLVWRRSGAGETLADYLSGRPAGALAGALGVRHAARGLDVGPFCAVVGTLLRALRDMHAAGVVHRDVKPGNVVVAPGERAPLQLIDFGSSCDTRAPFWSRGVNTLDPLFAAPERRLARRAPHKFDVFSVGMIGVAVLLPGFESEARLREFRNRLEEVGFDLYRYRDEFQSGHADAGLAALFNTRDVRAVAVFELLAGMLKKEPAARKSVEAGLADLGMG